MLRLELEGEVANLKAEADALVAEAAAEGRVVEPPDMTALSDERGRRRRSGAHRR